MAPPDACLASPCGPHSTCRNEAGRAVCACEAGTLGAPPSCRPQCVINQDCPLALACLGGTCVNPCVGSCGFNARCNVQNHQPICSCDEGYSGDPFAGCNQIESKCNYIYDFLYMLHDLALCMLSISALLDDKCMYV